MKLATSRKRKFYQRCRLTAVAFLIPFTAGGCPEFQNSVVEALSGATQAILLTDTDQQDAIDAATTSIASAAIDLFFSQFRSHQASR